MKKLLISFLAALMLLPSVTSVVLAAEKIPEIEQKEAGLINAQTTNQPNLESYGTSSYKGFLTDVYWTLMGGEPTVKGGSTSGIDGAINIVYSEGLVGGMGRTIAGIYGNPAATTERYVADLLNSAGFKIAQPAYAQGLGFSSLDPILDTWKTFRNIAYLGFVVIFLVIGFLIMLRQQVGQTAVTAQQAIPQIIVALLLVTFSYAIAGLLIDLMYIVMYLLLSLFVETENYGLFIDHNFLTLGLKMITSNFGSAMTAVQAFVASVLSGPFWNAIGKIGSLGLAVIVSFAIAFKIFELFVELLKTYATIILSVVFAPIFLMVGAIPGKNPAKDWLSNLIGNLAAFPIVLIILIVFNELTGGIVGEEIATVETGGFMPPYLLNTGSGFSGTMTMIVGVAMLTIMPELVKKGKEALGAKEGIFSQFAQDVGSSLKKGYKGDELIPGLNFTNPTKWGKVGTAIGSPENMFRKIPMGAAGAIGAGKGAYRSIKNKRAGATSEYTTWDAIRKSGGAAIRRTGSKLGDETWNEENFEKRQKEKEELEGSQK